MSIARTYPHGRRTRKEGPAGDGRADVAGRAGTASPAATGMGEVTVTALEGVDLRIERGEFTVVLGPSGSGKTTLLNMIGALDSPTEGRVAIAGRGHHRRLACGALRFRRRTVSFIFQTFNLFPALTAVENVEFGADVAGAPTPRAGAARDARARRARRPGASTSRTSSPAASSSAWASRGRWRRATRSCWRTSRRESSTSAPACRFSSCCTGRPTTRGHRGARRHP